MLHNGTLWFTVNLMPQTDVMAFPTGFPSTLLRASSPVLSRVQSGVLRQAQNKMSRTWLDAGLGITFLLIFIANMNINFKYARIN